MVVNVLDPACVNAAPIGVAHSVRMLYAEALRLHKEHAHRMADVENQINVSVMRDGVVKIATEHYVLLTNKAICAVDTVAVADQMGVYAMLGMQAPTVNGQPVLN
jgi:hypothetical protein